MGAISSTRIVKVRLGRVQPSGSWLYVWIDVEQRAVVYVGGTGRNQRRSECEHATHRTEVS
ncbi:hypothetical protein [Sinomonas humi]|uniref:Uncharacterized protein n=1 Tax=Sinomonas humi TaxID=1338436 RepID=A0A0B2AI51_9MICC|nr:hypothetical protein [Sinomonas humi]KHL01603.1 hypothetical protein LK10_15260 [Sinomonas humi]